MRADYNVKITFASKELSARERVAVKDLSNAVQLDEATRDGSVVINPDFYVELMVHNEKATDPDYEKFVLFDKGGTKFVTGSSSFINAFKDIHDEMDGSGEDYQIEAYTKPSKNYSGKTFLTCSIV